MKRNFVGTGLMLCCLCLFSFLGISQQVPLSIKGHGKVFLNTKNFNQKINYRQHQRPFGANSSCADDSVFFTRQSQIDSFLIDNPLCTVLRKIIIDGSGASPAITQLDGLQNITQVTELLSIQNTSITDLSDFVALTQIDGPLYLKYNNLLTGIGLNNLTKLGGMELRVLPALTTINGITNNIDSIFGHVRFDSVGITNLSELNGIVYINGDLEVSNTAITTLSGINTLRRLNYLYLNNDTLLSSVGLTQIDSTYGFLFGNLPVLTSLGPLSYELDSKSIFTFWFINTPQLTSLTGMDSVYSSFNFYIWFNPGLTSLQGLHHLTGNSYGFSIWYNQNLADISQLGNLTNVYDGKVELNNLPLLTGLSGLENITLMDNGFWLINNPLITTLTDLNPALVINTNEDSVRIFDNSQLSVCSSPPICNYLTNNPGRAEVHDNDAGCNDIMEITANCGSLNCTNSIYKTWNGNLNDDWNEPQNWSPSGVPEPCDSVLIPSNLSNYPLLNGNVLISYLNMEYGSMLDQNSYDLTVYGDVNIISSDIEGAGTLSVKYAANSIYIESSYFNPKVDIQQYTGSVNFSYSEFYDDVNISDQSSRIMADEFSGNTFYQNFTIVRNATNQSAVTYLSNFDDDFIEGDLSITINQAVTFDFFNTTHIGGNFTINSSFAGYPSTENASFDFISGNNSTVHITKTGSSELKFGNLSTNKWGDIILDQHLYINYNASFGLGIVHTDSSKMLIFKEYAGISQTSSGSYVDGPVRKIGTGSFRFPVGDSIYQAVCDITSPPNSGDSVTVQYFKKNPALNGYDTSLHAASLTEVSGKEYWSIKYNEGPANGSPEANAPAGIKVTLSYDSTRSRQVNTIYELSVARWNGSQWVNKGASAITGDNAQAFITSLNNQDSLGIYTFGVVPFRIPVITIEPADSIACVGSLFKVHFTVDTLMFPNNAFTLQLSDENGSFSPPFASATKNSFTSDSITLYNMPVLSGDDYKIRIIGNSPPDTSAIKSVSIKPFPDNATVINGPSTGCLYGGVHKYWVTPVQQGIYYTWSVTSGDTLTTNNDTAYVKWGSTGNHQVSVVCYNICGGSINRSKTVSVSPPPPTDTPVINNIGRWLYASVPAPSQNSLGYHWYKNDILISGANNASYYANEAGAFKVRYFNLCGESPASNTISFAANAIPQTINFPAISDKTYNEPPFVPSATASSGLPVSFSIVSGPASINPINNLLTILGVGAVTVKASQLGDNVYDTAATVTRTFNVNQASQTINFTSIPDQNFGSNINLLATATSGLPVSFNLVSGSATLSGNLLTPTGLGTITVRASQSGNSNYLPAANVDRSFCVRVAELNSISGPNSICPGVNATYTINNIPGANYTWRIAGGATLPSNTNSVTTVWPAPGNYTLIVSAQGSCGVPSANDSLAIVAVTSALPDSVNGMLPENNAINQQLPLTLSWIPANPSLNYTFDIYVWRSDSTQPGTPFVNGISTVNYTLSINSGLQYNQTYKWMVVAHNGSCTQINTGPIQQFSLIPLPDLQPINVQAPVSAFSGQTVAINWTVKNNGPGSTGSKSWTDAVFLSFDTSPNFSIPPETNPGGWSSLQFPIRTLLIGTKPNVSALDAGQQYSNSINFTLPVNYSVPLYVYVISNYPGNINLPQTTVANDTATAPQPIDVTLSPQPDLRVDTVFTPASTFTGSTLNLTYKVKNYGVLTPVNAGWYDKVFISNSPFFDINTATLLKFPKSNGTYYNDAQDAVIGNGNIQIQHDSIYTVNTQVVVPNFLSPGVYYIYVFTNATNSLYEGAASNNNVNYKLIQVFLTPTPTLTVSSLTVPVTTASTTQSIGINWNIKNTGFTDNIEKYKGHYGVQGASCPPNGFILTDSLGWGSSYWMDKVYISKDPVLNVGNAIYMGRFQHGGDRNVASALGYFNDYQYILNGCKPAGTNPASFNINTQNVIEPNKDFPTNLNLTIPDTLSEGNYYVYVYANPEHEVFEYPGAPQIKRSTLPITISRPDIVVNSVSTPANATGGVPFNISYTVSNNGLGSVFNHIRKDNLYISTSATFDNTAQLVGTYTYNENVSAGSGVPHTISYAFPPAATGTWYLYVKGNSDNSFSETNINNNISSAVAIAVSPGSPVDLIVSDFTLADTVLTSHAQLFCYTVINNGPNTTSGSWVDSLFVSCNAVFNQSTSYFIGLRNHSEILTSGASYRDSFYLTMPYSYYINSCFPQSLNTNAWFYVKTNANTGVYEGGNSSNNITGSGQRVLKNPFPDFIVTSVNGADTAVVGYPYAFNWTVKNLGMKPNNIYYYSNTHDAPYLSPDSVFNGNAIYLNNNYAEYFTLNTNQTYSDTKSPVIPLVPEGDYYALVKTNLGNVIEIDNTNNVNFIRNASGAAKKIHVKVPLLADLTDSIMSVINNAAIGQPLTVAYRVNNNGAGITYPNSWIENIYLSTDAVLGNGDILLHTKRHYGNLLPAAYYNDTITTSIIPQNLAPGNYVLLINTDANGEITESNESNNVAIRYITIFNPPPVDLLVQNVQQPDSVFLGYTIDTLKWKVFNNSPNTANGITTDAIYLSKNTVLDSSAVLIALKNKNINMGPLTIDSLAHTPIVTGVTEGSYNLIIKTDVLNNIPETLEGNNTSVSATPIYVKVKPLPLNTLTSSTLESVPRYYKLSIPDSLIGATLMVTLKSSDSLVANNQMYIGGGYIPSAAHFDYAYGSPNYGNQQIIMASVTDSVYYINVLSVSNGLNQNITLKAEVLPFSIVSVDANSGGNSGNVTIRIIGSLFTNNMTATLVKNATVIPATAIYYTNSTTVYATFNLQGRPLGIYDVILTKTDLSTAILTNGFSVVNPNNGGLITGGGVNTGAGNGNQPGCDPGAAAGLNSQLSIELVLPTHAFGGWPFPIQINYHNPTNNDIPAQTRVLYSVEHLPIALTQSGFITAGSSLYLTLSGQEGPPGIIRAGGSGVIVVYSKAPVTYPAHADANYIIK